jgi:hypothetical protein
MADRRPRCTEALLQAEAERAACAKRLAELAAAHGDPGTMRRCCEAWSKGSWVLYAGTPKQALEAFALVRGE